MELKTSSQKSGSNYSPDCANDHEEKEVSDDDDDDRNHKHRRHGTRSQSLGREPSEQVLPSSYRKRNKPFENGQLLRENESQASENWKKYNIAPLEKDFSVKFDKRRLGSTTFPRAPFDFYQRFKGNQTFPGDLGPGRGRGRDPASWNQHDSRFSSVDISSQMVQQGSIPPSLFAGRGLPNVSNAQNASWGAFGLIPGIPNAGLDTLHSIGMQGTIGPPINPSLSIAITRQRCRDFEERGFCLRGDMCPMEHGVNRIVIEDVQSLSQFNLPVSLPSAQLLGTPGGPGSLSLGSAPSTSLMNSKGLHVKKSKQRIPDGGLGLNGAYSGSATASAPDLYDPDQPLWNNDGPETSTAVLGPPSPGILESECLLDGDPSDCHHVKLCNSVDKESRASDTKPAVGSQSTSVSNWGRIGSSKDRSDMKDKNDFTVRFSDHLENETKEDQEVLARALGNARQGTRIGAEDAGPSALDSSWKTQTNTMCNERKRSQKATRTLFVNGIPQKNNTREALLSHFRRFGEVIDIYIPSNSERAFVQFSKREEAEAALKAPDAVMGNRFIKLWWANRDRISDDRIIGGKSVPPHGLTAASVPSPHPPITIRGKDTLQSGAIKVSMVNAPVCPLTSSSHTKPVTTNGPKVPLPLHKQLEELRKKQELLDQKRNDFRRELEQKLQKQGTTVKGEVVAEQAAKRLKVGVAAEVAKPATLRSTDPGAAMGSTHVEIMAHKNKSVDNIVSRSPKANVLMTVQQSTSSKQQLYPSVPAGAPFLIKRYKLDNRPTAFKINPPLPAGFANVSVLKEHFSSYGEISSVELEDQEDSDGGNGSETSKNCSVRITFIDRRSAEWAFVNGKCWEGHNLQFMWQTSSNCRNDLGGKENSPSAPKDTIDAQSENSADIVSPEAAASKNVGPDYLDQDSQLSQISPISEDKDTSEGAVSS